MVVVQDMLVPVKDLSESLDVFEKVGISCLRHASMAPAPFPFFRSATDGSTPLTSSLSFLLPMSSRCSASTPCGSAR